MSKSSIACSTQSQFRAVNGRRSCSRYPPRIRVYSSNLPLRKVVTNPQSIAHPGQSSSSDPIYKQSQVLTAIRTKPTPQMSKETNQRIHNSTTLHSSLLDSVKMGIDGNESVIVAGIDLVATGDGSSSMPSASSRRRASSRAQVWILRGREQDQ